MKLFFQWAAPCLASLFTSAALAANPAITDTFTADPATLVHNNTVYLYAGNDEPPEKQERYVMNRWLVYSSTDLVNWQSHPSPLKPTDFAWAKGDAWAGQVIERNGKFYWYVALTHASIHGKAIGVAVSDSPTGPFKDARGSALVTNDMTTDTKISWDDIDPSVFIDDDGQAYLFWGNTKLRYAKLKPNMTEFDGPFQTVDLPQFTEAPWVHKRGDMYYLSYATGFPEKISYATSKSIKGPWTPRGVLAEVAGNSNTIHQAILDYKGQSYFVYHNGSMQNGGGSFRRSVCIDKLEYLPDGLLKRVVQTSEGIAPVQSASAAAPAGYLFVTFKNGGSPLAEQIYFGLSTDGRNWSALNNAEPVLVSEIGDKGVRDPYLLRAHDGKTFYLIATDLSMSRRRDWKRAVREGSRSVVIWESSDLVHWSEPRLVAVAPEDAGDAWAPEAVYDEESGDYLMFWASTTKGDDYSKHRIWAARTKDFRTFSAPFIYIEKPTTVIDTTIVHDGKQYYRFTKDEKFKAVTMETAERLNGPWKDVPDFSLAKLVGYEGPEAYVIEPATAEHPAVWTLILDYYSKGEGYQPFVTKNLAGGQFTAGEGFSFPFKFRHGSILTLSAAEFARLKAAYGEGAKKPEPAAK